MNKSNQKKTKSLNKTLTETMNTYDGSNYIYDGSDDTINTEQEMIKKYSKPKVQTWEIMKETADKKELRELRKIEKKMNYKMKPIKKSSIDQRRESSKQVSDTYIPLDISIPKVITKEAALDDTLKRIEEDRNKVDPDFFRGLGTFFVKKF
tara:strand:+ start:363 stop:815 length:453 start_codon:yes stop_codon:yes gene_type:complete